MREDIIIWSSSAFPSDGFLIEYDNKYYYHTNNVYGNYFWEADMTYDDFLEIDPIDTSGERDEILSEYLREIEEDFIKFIEGDKS